MQYCSRNCGLLRRTSDFTRKPQPGPARPKCPGAGAGVGAGHLSATFGATGVRKALRAGMLVLAALTSFACSPQEVPALQNGGNGGTQQVQPNPEPVLISQYFDFDAESLAATLNAIAAANPGILEPHELAGMLAPSRSAHFLELVYSAARQPAEYFLLADKKNVLPEGYEPADLVRLADLTNPLTRRRLSISRPDHSLRQVLLDDLFEMDAAAAAEGITLVYSSTYRSYDYQVQTYNRWVRELGQVEADRVSAQPGKSQHQLGTVIDFGSITEEFADTAAGRWMLANGWKYGFTISYPQGYEAETGYAWEPWHYRWIGRPGAALCQEFFGGLQYRFLEFWNVARDSFLVHLKAGV